METTRKHGDIGEPQGVLHGRQVAGALRREGWRLCAYRRFSNQWWAYGSALKAATSSYPARR